ncbi:MAG TPA: hypothetical protein VNY76_02090, partial [Candidatus Acidoferrales bacterium]|nr:hypothetical protein [Candidatus Acidoferrales bacterium]
AFWTTAATVYVLWNVSTVVGAVAGATLGSPAAAGLDAAGPAAFTALLAPRLTTRPMRLVAFAAAILAIATVPLVPVGAPILIGGLAAVSMLWQRER